MRQFYSISVERLYAETEDSRRIGLRIPDELRGEFDFLPGQHLPIQTRIDGKLLRRTYSICSVPGHWPLEIGIRIQPGGRFSGFVAEELAVGDELEVMPPFGQFHASPDEAHSRTVLAFAAGSGITPILSIIHATLQSDSDSRVVLFYGNRRQRTTMFIEDLQALKNRFPERLQMYFLFSQEEQEFPIFVGRLDAAKVAELYKNFCGGLTFDDVFVCGPDTMIEAVRSTLIELGIEASAVHAERYGAPRKKLMPAAPAEELDHDSEVTVIMDGHKKTFGMSAGDSNLVDAAAAHGIELPFSCKGGVCATCRTHLRTGKVEMAVNYGLEPWEIEQGYILACQSRPVSDTIVLDYDRT